MTVRFGSDDDKRKIFAKRPQAAGFFSDDGYFVVAENDDDIAGFAAVFGRKIPAPAEETDSGKGGLLLWRMKRRKNCVSKSVSAFGSTERTRA